MPAEVEVEVPLLGLVAPAEPGVAATVVLVLVLVVL
jgi:hypothetical protein